MALTIRDIEYFLAVAQHGRLSAAAEEHAVTQPALTKAVQRVEAEFGLKLFERSAHGMRLSASGLRVVPRLQQLQASYTDAVRLSNEMRAGQAGLLRVGSTDTSPDNRLVAALAPLLGQRPGLRVRVRVDRSDVLATLVRDGELDLALIPAYDLQLPDVECTKIDSDPLVPLVRAGHPLLRRTRPAMEDATAFGWILGPAQSAAARALAEIHARARLPPPKVVVEVPFAAEMSLGLLAATDLMTLVPRSFLRRRQDPRCIELPIPALRIPRAVVLVSRPGSDWTPLMAALRDGMLVGARTPRGGR